jgi:hypothetical protein
VRNVLKRNGNRGWRPAQRVATTLR